MYTLTDMAEAATKFFKGEAVPKADFDTAKADADTATAQLVDAQKRIESLLETSRATTESLAAAQAEITALKARVETAEANAKTLEVNFKTAAQQAQSQIAAVGAAAPVSTAQAHGSVENDFIKHFQSGVVAGKTKSDAMAEAIRKNPEAYKQAVADGTFRKTL